MLKTNVDKLAMIGVEGEVDHPKSGAGAEGAFGPDGRRVNVPDMGGITYNHNIGDCCCNIRGEHIEPGVSSKNHNNPAENVAYMMLSCIGNTVKVLTGDAKGATGYVVGKHGGVHTMLYFDPDTLDQLTYEDKFMVRSFGMGLQLTDYPDVMLYNMDPNLLQKMGIREENGSLIVPVSHIIPSFLMGSGKGQGGKPWGSGAQSLPQRSDYDIITSDPESYQKYRLGELRYGDIVMIEDSDSTWGRTHREGSVTIGIIIHSDSIIIGHGPGVTTLMSCRKSGVLKGEIDKNANIACILGVKPREE